MVSLKTVSEIQKMQKACRIAGGALNLAGRSIKPGMTTKEIDDIITRYIVSKGAKPSFLGYGGFPASACISINDEVIHGIPGSRKVKEGDIVSIDVGAYYDGYHGDNAATFAVGEVSPEAKQLMEVTKQCLYRAIEVAKPGARIGDIAYAVQSYAESFGYGVVKKYVGHGVGRNLHESPEVPNFGKEGRGVRLLPGMTLAIEPMINLEGEDVKVLSDGWTVKTVSGSVSAHFEHTIAITNDGCVVLTNWEEQSC